VCSRLYHVFFSVRTLRAGLPCFLGAGFAFALPTTSTSTNFGAAVLPVGDINQDGTPGTVCTVAGTPQGTALLVLPPNASRPCVPTACLRRGSPALHPVFFAHHAPCRVVHFPGRAHMLH
jgi:hypothetical protein